jgi:transposase-like protein
MEKKNRRKFNAEFKAKVVLEALKERNTVEELGKKYEIHPNQIHGQQKVEIDWLKKKLQ